MTGLLTAVRALAFALTAFFLADLVGFVVASRLPADDVGRPGAVASAVPASRRSSNPRGRIAPVVQRNLFHTARPEDPTVAAPPPTPTTASPGELDESDLAQRFTLVGTIVAKQPEHSMAVIEEKSGEQQVYSLGELLGEQAEIRHIESHRIVLDDAGRQEQLTLDVAELKPAGKARPSALAAAAAVDGDNIRRENDGSYTVDAGFVDTQMQNLSQLITEVRAVPNFKDGKTDGFRLFSIKRGSLFDQIGLKNGDVVKGINQYELNDPAAALEVFQELRSARDFEVTVVRNGTEERMAYRVR